ncbi:pollen receptor-like kinase 3 [Tanacetum coccineum]
MAVVVSGHRFISSLVVLLSFHCYVSLSENPSSLALLTFKNSLSKSDSLTNWKDNDEDDDDSSSPCNPNNIWVGIVCSKDVVSSINLASMGLQGRPNVAAFASLEDLQAISFENNSLVGPIPAFNHVPSLKAIYVSHNQFSGVIPPNYFQPLGSLKRLWLSDNKFSGPIPKSLADLSSLKELHLENNEFSGQIPHFSDVEVLNFLDLSNNKLQGPIPNNMDKFDKKSFENNPELCGIKASKLCPKIDDPQSHLAKKLIIAAIVVILLVLVMSIKDKRKEENMRILRKENLNHEAVVTIPSISSRKSSSRKGYFSLNKSKSKSKLKDMNRSSPKGGGGSQPVGELVMVNEEKGFFGSEDLMKTSAEVLGNGGLGSAYKATFPNGTSVVLKKVREMNVMSKEVFDAEMRKLGRLDHRNVLTPLGYHFRKDDKFLISEYVPKGSLHNVLHGMYPFMQITCYIYAKFVLDYYVSMYLITGDQGIKHSELSWPNRLKMIKGVARGMGYLHSEFASYDLPHGNLKSCNVLIGQNYEPLVTDYAFYPLINSTHTAQSMFAFRSPEAIHRQQVSHKSDVYSLGIIILEMVTGKYPSQYITTNNQKGESGTDVVQWVRSALVEKRERELIDPDLLGSGTQDCVSQIQRLLHIGAACTESEVDTRIDMKEALRRIEDI